MIKQQIEQILKEDAGLTWRELWVKAWTAKPRTGNEFKTVIDPFVNGSLMTFRGCKLTLDDGLVLVYRSEDYDKFQIKITRTEYIIEDPAKMGLQGEFTFEYDNDYISGDRPWARVMDGVWFNIDEPVRLLFETAYIPFIIATGQKVLKRDSSRRRNTEYEYDPENYAKRALKDLSNFLKQAKAALKNL